MATTKKAGAKGKKSTTKRAAGKTAKQEAFRVPRSAKTLAAAIMARVQRSPTYWNDVKMAMATWEVPRVAQDMPRESATH